jgi:hypothetical protein
MLSRGGSSHGTHDNDYHSGLLIDHWHLIILIRWKLPWKAEEILINWFLNFLTKPMLGAVGGSSCMHSQNRSCAKEGRQKAPAAIRWVRASSADSGVFHSSDLKIWQSDAFSLLEKFTWLVCCQETLFKACRQGFLHTRNIATKN